MSDEMSRIYGFIFISKANSVCFRKAHIVLIVTGFLRVWKSRIIIRFWETAHLPLP